jgi:hypothetical protein
MRVVSLSLALSLLAAPLASAEAPSVDEATARVVELEAAVAQHKKDKDDNALAKDLDDVAAAHKATTDEKLRDRLNALLGSILKGAKNDGLEKAALKTIGDLGDESNWKYVRPYVIQPDPKTQPPLLLDGIETAGKLKAPEAVPLLLKIVEKSKVYPAAGAAMRALGNYGENKRLRGKILEEIVTTTRKNVPGAGGANSKGGFNPDTGEGGSTGGKGGTDASRWGVLSPALVEAANKLTGRTAASAEDWFELYDRHKGRLDDLFAQ